MATETISKLRSEVYQRGIRASQKFLQTNDMELPGFHDLDNDTHRNEKYLRRIRTCGFYSGSSRQIYVSPSRCAHPAGEKMSRRWSYPGFKIDRTPIGVAAHETGHHVDNLLFRVSNKMPRELRMKVHAISGYEPNAAESFAETMRVFILNPDLLRKGSPLRYEWIRDELYLKPFVRRNWQEVLVAVRAPERIIRAAHNWIERKK
jgi:hypothetical protein